MGAYVASQMVKALLKRRIHVDGARVLVMGLTFKENCPDLRNSRVIDVIEELQGFGCLVDVCDPWADAVEAKKEYGLDLLDEPDQGSYDGVIIAVAHDSFREAGVRNARSFGREAHVLYDLKHMFSLDESDLRL